MPLTITFERVESPDGPMAVRGDWRYPIQAPRPYLPTGKPVVRECEDEPGHFVYRSLMGWHDCTPGEDAWCMENR